MKKSKGFLSMVLVMSLLVCLFIPSVPVGAAIPAAIHEWRMDSSVFGNPDYHFYDYAGTSNATMGNGFNDIVPDPYFGGCLNPQDNYHFAYSYAYTLDMSQDYTISMWFKSERITESDSILLLGDPYHWTDFSITVNSVHRIYFECNNNTGNIFGMEFGTDVDDGTWKHLTITYNASNNIVYGYINGVLENYAGMNEFQIYTTPVPSNNRIFFGNGPTQVNPLKGGLAKVRMYSAMFGTAEALAQYNAENPYVTAPKALYEWKCLNPGGANPYIDGTGTNNSGINVNTMVNFTAGVGADLFPSYFSPKDYSEDGVPYAYAVYDEFDMGGSFTVSTWAKVSTVNKNGYDLLLCDKLNDIPQFVWNLQINSIDKPYFQILNPAGSELFGLQLNTSVRDNTWHNITIVYDDSTGIMTGYVDGIQDGTGTPSSTAKEQVANNGNVIVMGNRADLAAKLAGGLANMRLFNQALNKFAVKQMIDSDLSPELIVVDNSGLTIERDGMLDTISGINENETVWSIKNKFKNANVRMLSSKGAIMTNSDIIGTGTKIQVLDAGWEVDELTAVIYGDTDGDGAVALTDIIGTAKHLASGTPLSGAYLKAAGVYDHAFGTSNGVSPNDLIAVKKHIMGVDPIIQAGNT